LWLHHCVVDYFTKWVEALPTFSNNCTTMKLFMLNHIIAQFSVPKTIVMDHGSHFHNKMMTKLGSRLGFHHENSTPYYPQSNGQVEATNHMVKTMIQRMVGKHKN
jgi:transposase InsO family protein